MPVLLREKKLPVHQLPDRFLAMNMGGGNEDKLNGVATIEPVFGIKAKWVSEKIKGKLKSRIYCGRSFLCFGHPSFGHLKKSAYMILEKGPRVCLI